MEKKIKQPIPPQLVGKTLRDRPQDINRKGRPKDFDQLRKMILEMGNEEIQVQVGKGKNKKTIELTRFERILLDWFNSQGFDKQQAIMQHSFGKIPDKLEISGLKTISVALKKKEDDGTD